jgi:hypothetical protein
MALTFFLYWSVPWFDVLMHFLGGVWIAALVYWFLRRMVPFVPLSSQAIFAILLGATFLVGIAWEVFEYLVGTYFTENYPLDTSIDLLMDLVGAGVLYYLVTHSPFRSMLN